MNGTANARVHKNVTLIGSPRTVADPFKLLDPAGAPIAPFSIFARLMAKGPINTYRTYCYHIADFMDYLYEAGFQLSIRHKKEHLTRADLRSIIDAWDEYLVLGPNSQYEIALWVNSAIPSKNVSQQTSNNKHAALTKFINLSEKIRRDRAGMVEAGLSDDLVDDDPLYVEVSRSIHIDRHQRAAMLESSMLAGSIAGSRTDRDAPIFNLPSLNTSYFDERRIFPLDSLHSFIEELRSYRDKALYSLYAACGCRSSEGLQILWEDIDIDKRDIRLVNPGKRANHPSYLALSYNDRKQLVWKGRQTEVTFLIEPFVSMFFEYLQKYVENEYYPHNDDKFVFQMLRKPYRGRPYFLTAPDTRRGVFVRAAKRIGLPPFIDGPHTIRHAYATYLLNYVPTIDGQHGLPMGIVKVAMGHADIKQTAKYAVHDRDLLQAQLAYGNALIFGGNEIKTLNQLKIDALRAQIDKLERAAGAEMSD